MKSFDEIRTAGFSDPSTVQGAILYGFFFAFFGWLLGHLLRAVVQRMLARDDHNHLDLMAVKFLAKLVRYCVYVVAFISYAHFVPALSGLGVASLTSVSIISVIVGLAAQNTLGNLIAGISLLLYRPFKLGDRLQVLAPTGLETGFVEGLTLGYTLMITDDNRRVVIPNSLMASQTTINLTGNDPRVICSVAICIRYGADVDKARAILIDLARKHPRAMKISGCPLVQLDNLGFTLRLEVWCVDALTAETLRCDLLEQAMKRFYVEGIVIPPPPATIVLKDERHLFSKQEAATTNQISHQEEKKS